MASNVKIAEPTEYDQTLKLEHEGNMYSMRLDRLDDWLGGQRDPEHDWPAGVKTAARAWQKKASR